MTEPLRVTIVTDSAINGGAERSLAHLVAHLSSGVAPTILGSHPATVGFIARHRPDAQIAVVGEVRGKLDVRGIRRLRRALRATEPDVVHVNLTGPRSCRFALLAALVPPRMRVVAVEQLPLPPATRWQRWWRRQLHRRLGAHVAVGVAAARHVEAHLGLPAGEVMSIHNGVPDPAPRTPLAGTTSPRCTVGTVARFEAQKGLDVLLRAVAPLDVDVRLVGDGPERPALVALAEQLELTSRLTFAGWSDDVSAELDRLDVFVLASRNEGFPLAIVEAMLAGLPVVATDVGSVAEAIEPGVTGLLVPPDDERALRDAIASLLADPTRRDELGEAARARAASIYTAAAMAERFEQLYARLVTT